MNKNLTIESVLKTLSTLPLSTGGNEFGSLELGEFFSAKVTGFITREKNDKQDGSARLAFSNAGKGVKGSTKANTLAFMQALSSQNANDPIVGKIATFKVASFLQNGEMIKYFEFLHFGEIQNTVQTQQNY